MAIFFSKERSFNTNLFHIIEVVEGNPSVTQEAGLYHVNLINMNVGSEWEEKGKINVMTSPKKHAYMIYDFITNFWFSENKKMLPDTRSFTFDEIKESFPLIVEGDHESGEFGLYKISGNVVLFVKSEDGELSDDSEQIKYGDLAYKEGKNVLLETMEPLLNPLILACFKNYINGDSDLEEFKLRVKKAIGGNYKSPKDYDSSEDWSRLDQEEEE